MKLNIQTSKLVSALAALKPIAKPNRAYPILSNVLLEASGNTLTLKASDMEKQLTISIPCEVSKSGSTTVPCSKLHDSVSRMRAIESTLECNAADELTVKAGSATTKIKGLSAKEMPPIVEVKGGKEVSIPAEILVPFLKKSLAHTSADKSLGNLTSVSIVSRDGKMNIQATNRRHCIICETDVDLDSSDAYIIPHESVSSLIGISSGEVKMRLSLDAMSAEAESGMFATKLYEGPLPDFRMTFPKDLPTHIIVDRDKLMALVEYVEVQTTQDIQHITLSSDGVILTAKGAAGIAAPDAFVDMNQDWIQCEPGSGKFTFAVNPQFLKDAIKATEEQLITIECADPVRNVVINEGAVSIAICPIKLQ